MVTAAGVTQITIVLIKSARIFDTPATQLCNRSGNRCKRLGGAVGDVWDVYHTIISMIPPTLLLNVHDREDLSMMLTPPLSRDSAHLQRLLNTTFR